MVIPKEDALSNQTQAQGKCPVLHQIRQFSKSSQNWTTASDSSYEVGVNGEKNVNGNWDIINKNGQSTCHTGKSGNFNSLRENYIMALFP